jgi:hypothetical protein
MFERNKEKVISYQCEQVSNRLSLILPEINIPEDYPFVVDLFLAFCDF